jgi:hypothetical protein
MCSLKKKDELDLFSDKLITILILIASVSFPYMLYQVSLQAAVLGPIMNCSVYLEHLISKLINWTMMIIDQDRRLRLITVIIISRPIMLDI